MSRKFENEILGNLNSWTAEREEKNCLKMYFIEQKDCSLLPQLHNNTQNVTKVGNGKSKKSLL